MFSRAEILGWREVAPWADEGQVEQDLVITHALFDIFGDEWLAERLAFRGGTALHRLHLAPPARYSEDIDLVQRIAEGIGPTFDRLRDRLGWIGKASTEIGMHPKMEFRFDADDGTRRKLKLEVNTHEHFGDVVPFGYRVESEVFSGEVEIPTYSLDELLGTKLRALYQRRKGRDLFDFWWAQEQAEPDPGAIVAQFRRYMGEAGFAVPSAPELRMNLEEKRRVDAFDEVLPLLRTGISYDSRAALAWFEATFLPWLDNDDGERWFAD